MLGFPHTASGEAFFFSQGFPGARRRTSISECEAEASFLAPIRLFLALSQLSMRLAGSVARTSPPDQILPPLPSQLEVLDLPLKGGCLEILVASNFKDFTHTPPGMRASQ